VLGAYTAQEKSLAQNVMAQGTTTHMILVSMVILMELRTIIVLNIITMVHRCITINDIN